MTLKDTVTVTYIHIADHGVPGDQAGVARGAQTEAEAAVLDSPHLDILVEPGTVGRAGRPHPQPHVPLHIRLVHHPARQRGQHLPLLCHQHHQHSPGCHHFILQISHKVSDISTSD